MLYDVLPTAFIVMYVFYIYDRIKIGRNHKSWIVTGDKCEDDPSVATSKQTLYT